MTFEERKAARAKLNSGKYKEAIAKAKYEKRQRQEKEEREAKYPHVTEKRIEAVAEQELKNDREQAKREGKWSRGKHNGGLNGWFGDVRAFSGVCFKQCANRDIKCHECCKINGKETEYVPLEAMVGAA